MILKYNSPTDEQHTPLGLPNRWWHGRRTFTEFNQVAQRKEHKMFPHRAVGWLYCSQLGRLSVPAQLCE